MQLEELTIRGEQLKVDGCSDRGLTGYGPVSNINYILQISSGNYCDNGNSNSGSALDG